MNRLSQKDYLKLADWLRSHKEELSSNNRSSLVDLARRVFKETGLQIKPESLQRHAESILEFHIVTPLGAK